MGGPEPLQPGTIRDWMALTAHPMSQDEIKVMLRLDQAFIAAYNAEQKEAREAAEEENKRKTKEQEEARRGYSTETKE
jgi:hypothetical protein